MSIVGKDWKGKEKDDEGDADKKGLSGKMVRQRKGSHDDLPDD